MKSKEGKNLDPCAEGGLVCAKTPTPVQGRAGSRHQWQVAHAKVSRLAVCCRALDSRGGTEAVGRLGQHGQSKIASFYFAICKLRMVTVRPFKS